MRAKYSLCLLRLQCGVSSAGRAENETVDSKRSRRASVYSLVPFCYFPHLLFTRKWFARHWKRFFFFCEFAHLIHDGGGGSRAASLVCCLVSPVTVKEGSSQKLTRYLCPSLWTDCSALFCQRCIDASLQLGFPGAAKVRFHSPGSSPSRRGICGPRAEQCAPPVRIVSDSRRHGVPNLLFSYCYYH